MGLWERMGRVVRAQVSAWTTQAEDPEKLLIQTVETMEQDLQQMRQAVAEAIALQKRTERQESQVVVNAQEWQQRAKLAVDQGNEGLAREALVKRRVLLTQAATYGERLQEQRAIASEMKRNLRLLEMKLAEMRAKRDVFLVRARSAEVSQRLGEMMDQYNPQGALAAFERMEERVLELEARAKATAELGQDPMEGRFAVLEEMEDVEAELRSLREN